jgi:hypothetical protein
MTEFTQVVNQGFMYVNGLGMEWLSSSTLQVSPGMCRDSTNSIDIPVNVELTLNTALLGAGGLDQGVMAINSSYNVYVIFDPTLRLPPSVICGLSKDSDNNLISLPQIPYGYAIYRRIGYFTTVANTNIYNFWQNGSGSQKFYNLDYPVTIGFTTNSPSYTTVDLTPALPSSEEITAILNVNMNAGSTVVGIRTLGSPNGVNTSNYITVNSANGQYPGQFQIITALNGSNNPSVEYSANGGGNIRVVGYIDSL